MNYDARRLSPMLFSAGVKRFLSIATLPSTTLIRYPPYETHKCILPRQLVASKKISETTHVDESHLNFTFCSEVLKILAKTGSLRNGKQMHAHILKLGYNHILSLQNQLLNVYVKCRAFDDVYKMFDEMPSRNVVSWNMVISSLNRNIQRIGSMGLWYFKQMLVDMVEPNYITFISLFTTCVELNDMQTAEQLHCFIVKLKLSSDTVVGGALADLYGKCGLVEDAIRLFDRILAKDLVLWNVMVSCYTLNGLGEKALGTFNLLRSEGFQGDDFTFSSLLSSCGIIGSCGLGMQIHSLIIRLCFDVDLLVASSLVDMYVKTGTIEEARTVFDGMTIRNVVSWTTMIVGYGRCGDGKEGMKLLKEMLRGGFYPDELTSASILSSCANSASYTETIQVHAHATKKGFGAFLSIGNALINAYSKCGSITYAFQYFSSITGPNLVTWTSMIGAYAFHGLSKQAVHTFEQMLAAGIRPDQIAFLGVLSACSHGGLVDDGFRYFHSMARDHNIVPDLEHYSCLVDLLGRAGQLDKAYKILVNMPIEPSVNVWGAFIGACRAHGNVESAKWAAEKLYKLDPKDPVNYTLMANIYASEGQWIDVARLRKMMRDKCDYKVPGCSWIELGGKVHTFASSDKLHSQAADTYALLGLLVTEMDQSYK